MVNWCIATDTHTLMMQITICLQHYTSLGRMVNGCIATDTQTPMMPKEI